LPEEARVRKGQLKKRGDVSTASDGKMPACPNEKNRAQERINFPGDSGRRKKLAAIIKGDKEQR